METDTSDAFALAARLEGAEQEVRRLRGVAAAAYDLIEALQLSRARWFEFAGARRVERDEALAALEETYVELAAARELLDRFGVGTTSLGPRPRPFAVVGDHVTAGMAPGMPRVRA